MKERIYQRNIGKLDVVFTLGVMALLLTGGALAMDWSGDGLRAVEDFHSGTNPLQQDTLGNGLTDYEEVHVHGTDPLANDTTGDGLTDYKEVHVHGTDPTTNDTTGDGLTDYEEIRVHGTDPTTTDTIGNGLTDYEEVRVHGTDPLSNDTTGDGLTDYKEVHVHETDPTTIDTTGDGLTDYDQVYEYGTDPSVNDTIGNGLSDYDELYLHNTDPLTDDTTGDGLDDYIQVVEYGSDPTLNDTLRNGLPDAVAANEYGLNPIVDPAWTSNVSTLPDHELIHTEKPLTPVSGLHFAQDSSGDGFPDSITRGNENLSTSEIDVVVHVSYMEGTDVPISSLLNVQQAFAEAPIGDSEGVRLHFYIDENPVEHMETVNANTYQSNYYRGGQYDEGYGMYHLLIADQVQLSGQDAGGFALPATDGIVVGDSISDQYVGGAIMHELGHQIGLIPDDFYGVDSTRLSTEEYPSIMNYNVAYACRTDVTYCYQFSDSGIFNDWSHIESRLPHAQADITQLRDRW